MRMPREISLSTSSSSSSCRGIGSDNGSVSDLCHPQTILQMNESGSKSSEFGPPVIEIEDDDASTKAVDTTAIIDDKADNNTRESASTSRLCTSTTIPVRPGSGEKVNTITELKRLNHPNNPSVKNETNTIERTEASDNDTKGEASNFNKKDIMNVHDAIADLAASSNLRSRRIKRERSDTTTTTSQETATPAINYYMPMISQPPTIVTASMNNYYVPPRLQFGTESLKSNALSRTKSNKKNPVFGTNGPNKKKVSVHMLNSVGLECGDDGTLRLERFDDDDTASMYANNVYGDCPIKGEGETKEKKNTTLNEKRKPPMWTLQQHRVFATTIFEIGLKNCSPSIIMENMRKQPKYITRERTKSHLQKYRQTKERSKSEFLKEYDAFFESTEQAKDILQSKNSKISSVDSDKSIDTIKNFKHKEPIPKAILSMALEGKKPSKLLGGKAAALLSYSVLNGFSTTHGPDQLQYKAAKFSELPSMTEEEKRSSVGASLLQVKSLIDNMTDVLLKTRHGIKAFPLHESGIGDDESVSSSICSSDDGYSAEDNIEGAEDKNVIGKTGSKDPNSIVEATTAPKIGPFPMGVIPGGPALPLYRGPPTAYPAPFPTQGAPPPVATAFPPPQYPHAQPPFFGGAPPPPHLTPATAPAFGVPAGFHHPQMHYAQDPRINPYQQPPPAQVGSYRGVHPMQPNYYPAVATYPAYYGSTIEGNMNPGAGNASAEYSPHPDSSGGVFAAHSHHRGDEQQQRQNVYDHHSQSYANDGRSDRRTYDTNESSTEKRSRRRAEKKSKHRRIRDDRSETSLSVDTSVDLKRTGDNDFGAFLDRLSKVPSPSKASQQSSSPIERSRRRGRFKSSQKHHQDESQIQNPKRKRYRHVEEPKHHQQQFDVNAQSNSYVKNSGSPEAEADHFPEGGDSRYGISYEGSPVDQAPSERSQNQAYVDQQHHSNNGQLWQSPNFREAGYNNQQQPQNAGGGDFHQQPAQIDEFVSRSAHQKPEHYHSYDGVGDQSSPEGGSTTNFFF